jgi:phosphatidylserine/phosphatidylglycerophosphate/cardiolipin synthase-like enzyme
MTLSTHPTSRSRFRVFFGGPDLKPRLLRDLLEARISAVPAGGEIFWATYYFRDIALANALIQAKERGARVCLTLEATPRTSRTNIPVLSILQRTNNLSDDCRSLRHRCPDNLLWKKPRLHLKLYYFSHPEPHVLIGTFNPSGNQPEDPQLIEEIGDQDRGHNYLVEIGDSRLVEPLRKHLLMLHAGLHGPWERLLPRNNRAISADDSMIYLFPRLRRDILLQKLLTLPSGTTLRMAISHLNDERIGKTLLQLARRGVLIKILAHDTERRVPGWMEELFDGQLSFRRYRHPQGLPMHNKFILIESHHKREVLFGSMNLSKGSLHANHELLVASSNLYLYDAFHSRWEKMINETEAML